MGKEIKGKKREIKRRIRIKDENAPKAPRSAYLHYLNFKRNSTEFENSDCKKGSDFMVGWKALTDEEKKPFYELAAVDRMKYEKEVENYRKTDLYKVFQEKRASILSKCQNKKNRCANEEENAVTSAIKDGDISIFSNAFLDYNKSQESKLKKLRVQISTLEEESELIRENIKRLEANIEMVQKIKVDTDDRLSAIGEAKAKWTKILVSALEEFEISGETPTIKNIDSYMAKLDKIVKRDPNSDLVKSIKVALSSSNFN